jgi:hypothetical protein
MNIHIARRNLSAFGAFLLTLALAGCGTRSGSVGSGQAQQDDATQLMSTLVLVRKWSEVLYTQASPPAMPCPFNRGPIRRNPDGSFSQTITYENCVVETRTLFPGVPTPARPRTREFVLPDTRTITDTITREVTVGTVFTQDVRRQYSGGDVVTFTSETDTRGTANDAFDDTTRIRGRIEFTGLSPAQFALEEGPGMRAADSVEMTLTDGAEFKLDVPVDRVPATDAPLFGEVTSGSYRPGRNGAALTFELRGTGVSAWDTWTVTLAEGTTGRFSLNEDFSGSGLLVREGQLQTSLRWDADGTAAVTPLGEEAATVGPSAAALAFLRHAWRELIVRTGPGG